MSAAPSLAPTVTASRTGTPGTDGVALPEVVRLLRRRWRAVLVPTVVACLGAVAFVQVVSPRYTGETKVLLESRDTPYTRTSQDRADPAQTFDEQAVASQAQVVMSRDLAREAIKRLNLVGNPEFDPVADGIGPVQRVLMALRLVPNVLDRDPVERVIDRYFDHLAVYPAGKSRILTVEFRAKDAALAAKGANTIADLYLASLEAAKIDTARYASTWLGSNIDTLRSRVSEAESKVETFRAKNSLLGGGSTNQPLGTQQLTELSTQLVQARGAQADATAKAKLIKDLIKDGRAFDIPDVANNEMIRRLVEQRITLRAQLALESRTLLPGHPRIKELTAQLGDLEGQVRAAADRTVRTLESDARIAGARLESLQAAVDSQSGVVAKANTNEVQLRALEREAKAQRDQLESYLSRYREAAARDAESAAPPDARVVSRAIVSDTPSFPKKLPIILFVTLAALIFSVGVIVARDLLGRSTAAAEEDATDAVEEEIAPVPAPRRRPVVALRPRPDLPTPDLQTPDLAQAASAAVATPAAAAPAPFLRPTMAPSAPASADEAPFDLAGLIARIGAAPSRHRGGRRTLVLGAADQAERLAEAVATELAGAGRALVVSLAGDADAQPGLSDIVLGEAAFLEAIQSRPRSRVHRIGSGTAQSDLLVEEAQGFGITLDALSQAYEQVICHLAEDATPELRRLAASRMDVVVIASDAKPEDPALVALYEAMAAAGSAAVLVAHQREEEPADSAVAAWPNRRFA